MQNYIEFVLDGKIQRITFSPESEYKPTTTVLNYLRSFPEHKGVKEGCAEGDCGACTVVIAALDAQQKLQYKTINSCLVFLPMIHGKWLITVENLAHQEEKNKILHPVQAQMVETNGSQCGYCTPGFIMSLFGLFKNHQNPTREVIEDALAGNLCRCTGYQPIIEAAEKSCVHHGEDHFSQREKEIIQLLSSINCKETCEINNGTQTYFKPFTLQESLRLRAQHTDALIVCGSTDIALRQTKKKELLHKIIDISAVQELKEIREDGNNLFVGASVTMEQLKNKCIGSHPALNNVLAIFGSLQIRNSATIGGNISSASPIGDSLPVLFAYKASLKVISQTGERIVSIEKFIKGYRQKDLKNDELISEIIIPKPNENQIVRSYKVSKRKDLDISTVSGGFRLELENDSVKELILAFGGMAAYTKRAEKTEQFLNGKKWNLETIKQAQEILYKEFSPLSDARSGEEYRRLIAKNLLLKFYNETCVN